MKACFAVRLAAGWRECFLVVGAGCLLFLLPASAGAAEAPAGYWAFEALGGDAWCFRTPLEICLENNSDISISAAEYETHSFETPIYYAVRFGRWRGDRAWELEMVHLKIDLQNGPEPVGRFEVSHGYNLVTVNRAWLFRRFFVFRLGAGAVVAHPESTIHGQGFDEHGSLLREGYYLSGPTAQAAAGLRFDVYGNMFLTLEGKLTASYARVPVADGYAHTPVAAAHLLAGAGVKF